MATVKMAEMLRAHALLDRTRCAGWLAASGNRPRISALDQSISAKGPQPVSSSRTPNHRLACDIHPLEDGDA